MKSPKVDFNRKAGRDVLTQARGDGPALASESQYVAMASVGVAGKAAPRIPIRFFAPGREAEE